MQCRTVRHGATTPLIHPDLSGAPFGPSRLTPLIRPLLTSARRSEGIAPPSVRLPPNTEQISQGKTQNFHCISARFIKPTPIAEGGLRCSVPARPGWTTPHIWFLFVAPQFWNQASFRPHLAMTPLPYPSLRLCEHLAEDFHLFSSVPCLAHTSISLSGAPGVRFRPGVGRLARQNVVARKSIFNVVHKAGLIEFADSWPNTTHFRVT